MHVLFVHGMGRTPISGMIIQWRLRRDDHSTSSFSYSTAFQDFDAIRDRLCKRITGIASGGEYTLYGHSLGGVLIRSALAELSPGIHPPAHVFLLGSPIAPARMAKLLRRKCLYRMLTGDCGQLLASDERMGAVGPLAVRTTSIIGVRGVNGHRSPFGEEPNDGVVATSELAAEWIAEEIRVPVIHTLLPASLRVANIMLERLAAR